MKHLLRADELQEGDVLLDGQGKPALRWPNGEPKHVLMVEVVARVTFEDHTKAEWPGEHELDVER